MSNSISQDAISRLSELLMSPEQLDRVDTLKQSLFEKQKSIQGQLVGNMQTQLEQAKKGTQSLEESSKNMEIFHKSFQEVSYLCNQSKNRLPQYPIIKKLTIIRENLKSCVENSKHLCETGKKVKEIRELLKDNRQVYNIHKDLHSLEELRREALIQMKELPEQYSKLLEQFQDLDSLIKQLEECVMKIFEESINYVSLRPATLVKAVLVIEREEKYDKKRKRNNSIIQERLQGVKKNSEREKELLAQIQPIRDYKAKAFKRLQSWIVQHFEFCFADLESDLEITVQDDETLGFALTSEVQDVTQRYLKEADQILKDLDLVRDKMAYCMPKRYNIMDFFFNQYHSLFFTLILRFANQSSILSAKDTINLVSWVKSTYEVFLDKVGKKDIEPSLIEPLEELIRGFRQHIKKLLDQWTPRLIEIDRKSPPEEVLGIYYTDSPVTLFKIIKQQMQVVVVTNYNMLTFQVVLECIESIQSFQNHINNMFITLWRELEFEYLIALVNNNKKSIIFVNNFETSVKEILDDYYFSQVNFESNRQGFLKLADNAICTLAKAICRDFEEVMSLTGTKEWRDTEDPYMDAICDTIIDYFDNDVKMFLDKDYHSELLKQCINRVIALFINALLIQSRNKCSINDAFIARIKLEKRILYDFGMEYIGFEKFIREALSILNSLELFFSGNVDDVLESIKELYSYQHDILSLKLIEYHLSRRSNLDKIQIKTIISTSKNAIFKK